MNTKQNCNCEEIEGVGKTHTVDCVFKDLNTKQNQERAVEEIVEELVEKYSKDYEIKSEPENYIHTGLNSAEFASHFRKDLIKTLKTEREKREEVKLQVEKEILKCVTGEDDNCYYLRVAKDSPLFITQPNN